MLENELSWLILSVCRRTHITLKEAIRQHLTREQSGACFVERPLCLSRCRDMYLPTNTKEKRVILRYPICHHILAFSSHDSAFEPAQNACSRFSRMLDTFTERDEIDKGTHQTKIFLFSISCHFIMAEPIY